MLCENTAIIITGCIMPRNVPYLQLTNIAERLDQYLNSISFYIEHSNIKKIIFCENSNYPYDYSAVIALAQKNHKELEILSFQGDFSKVEKKGKGYGEGEILDYVLFNSRLIQNVGYIYKITGRLVIENFEKLSILEDRSKVYFNKNIYSYKSLDTRFWGMPKKIYIQYFKDAYKKVDDTSLRFLEFVFWDAAYHNSIAFHCHPAFPLVNGISGSTNSVYRESIPKYRRLFSVCSKMRLFNNKSVYFIIFFIFNRKSCISNYRAIARSRILYFLNLCWSKIYHVYAITLSKLKYIVAVCFSTLYRLLAITRSRSLLVIAKGYGKLRITGHAIHVIFSLFINKTIQKLSDCKHFCLNIFRYRTDKKAGEKDVK